MKTDSLSQGGKEKESALRERGKESVLHSTDVETLSFLWKSYLL